MFRLLAASGITTGRTWDMMFYPSLSMAKIPVLRSYSASFLRIFSSLAPSPELGVSELSKLNHDLQNSSVPILDPQGRVCHYIFVVSIEA